MSRFSVIVATGAMMYLSLLTPTYSDSVRAIVIPGGRPTACKQSQDHKTLVLTQCTRIEATIIDFEHATQRTCSADSTVSIIYDIIQSTTNYMYVFNKYLGILSCTTSKLTLPFSPQDSNAYYVNTTAVAQASNFEPVTVTWIYNSAVKENVVACVRYNWDAEIACIQSKEIR